MIDNGDVPMPQGKHAPPGAEEQQAQRDHDEFFGNVADVKTANDLRSIDPEKHRRASKIGRKAGVIVTDIVQDAGNIPDNDPRHQIFDLYNKIAERWYQLSPPKRALE